MDGKQVLTIKETAKEYGLSEYTVRTLLKRGDFPVIQNGSKCYISRVVFEEYLKTGGALYVAPHDGLERKRGDVRNAQFEDRLRRLQTGEDLVQ